MADNVVLNPGLGGSTVRTIEISSKHYQVVMSAPEVLSQKTAVAAVQTNLVLINQAAGGRLGITQIHISADNDNSTDPAIVIGLGSASVPSTTDVIYSHPGLPSGFTDSRGGGLGFLAVGTEGQDLRMSMDEIANVDVVVSYVILPIP